MALAASPSLILAVSHSPTSGPNQAERGGCMPISRRSGSVSPRTAELHLVSAGVSGSLLLSAGHAPFTSFFREGRETSGGVILVLFTVALEVRGPPLRAEIYDDSTLIRSLCVAMAHTLVLSLLGSKQLDSVLSPALSLLRRHFLSSTKTLRSKPTIFTRRSGFRRKALTRVQCRRCRFSTSTQTSFFP